MSALLLAVAMVFLEPEFAPEWAFAGIEIAEVEVRDVVRQQYYDELYVESPNPGFACHSLRMQRINSGDALVESGRRYVVGITRVAGVCYIEDVPRAAILASRPGLRFQLNAYLENQRKKAEAFLLQAQAVDEFELELDLAVSTRVVRSIDKCVLEGALKILPRKDEIMPVLIRINFDDTRFAYYDPPDRLGVAYHMVMVSLQRPHLQRYIGDISEDLKREMRLYMAWALSVEEGLNRESCENRNASGRLR